MSIPSGSILHDANGFVIDRIQSAGVSNVNIPEEKIYELGNFKTVATVRDIPDLSFDVESFDVSTEIEAILLNLDNTGLADGTEFDFADSKPLDVISPFKSAINQYDIVKGIALPYLTLESATYRFGLRQNATQSFTLRGDSIYYTPDAPYWEEFTVTAGTNQTYNFAETAVIYQESGDSIYALGVCAKEAGTNNYKRLFFGEDFTNTSAGVTILEDLDSQGYDTLHVTYAADSAGLSYTQAGNNPTGNTIHEGTGVKPAAVRGKDIDLYVATSAATPTMERWTGVQSVEFTRRVNLENDEEFGNYHYVSSSYDTAEVNGSVVIKPEDPEDLFAKLAQIANVSASEVIGAHSSTPLPVEVRISDPDSNDVLKTLYVPDARFTIPAVQGRVQQKLQVTLPFSSDEGELLVYKGARP